MEEMNDFSFVQIDSTDDLLDGAIMIDVDGDSAYDGISIDYVGSLDDFISLDMNGDIFMDSAMDTEDGYDFADGMDMDVDTLA